MSNHSLWTELSFHSVDAEEGDTLLDELFQVVNVELKNDIVIAQIYTPLNYSNLKRNRSHVKRDGMYFYIVNGNKIRFMLDADKAIDIDGKQDRLRIRLMWENYYNAKRNYITQTTINNF